MTAPDGLSRPAMSVAAGWGGRATDQDVRAAGKATLVADEAALMADETALVAEPSAFEADEAALVAEPSAFEAVVRPHYANLVRRLVLVLGNQPDAEDVAQETYLRAWRSWARFDGTDVRAWLYTIALRLAFNQLRSRRRWLAALGRTRREPWSDHVDPDLAVALSRLDARPRAALLLNVIDGYTQAEIGRMLGVPEGTVASWISRARSTLRAALVDTEDVVGRSG